MIAFTFRRDPALFVSLCATLIRMISAFWFPLNFYQQSSLNAFVAAVAGMTVAYTVRDGQVAALLGIVQALIAVGIGFGLHFTPESQGLIMSLIGTMIAMFVRTQVKAPQPPALH